jgi:hypothetical protein
LFGRQDFPGKPAIMFLTGLLKVLKAGLKFSEFFLKS